MVDAAVHGTLHTQRDRSSLVGRPLPPVELLCVGEGRLNLASLAQRALVICIFGLPGSQEEIGRLVNWTSCTPRLPRLGYRFVAISHEPFAEQLNWASLVPDWLILSDTHLLLARALRLPTVVDSGVWRYEPATLLTHHGRITHASYSSRADSADQVLTLIGHRE